MSFMSFFGDKDTKTTTNSTQNTSNTSTADSFNTTLNQSLSRNESYISADSTVNNLAFDSSRSYNLANVGNISGGDDSGWLADAVSALDLDRFFATTSDNDSEAIGAMDFGGAVTSISDKLKALTGLQEATLKGQAEQTLANKSDSPTAKSNSLYWVIGLAIVGILALVWFLKRRN